VRDGLSVKRRDGALGAETDLAAVVDEHDAEIAGDEGEEVGREPLDFFVEQILAADQGLSGSAGATAAGQKRDSERRAKIGGREKEQERCSVFEKTAQFHPW
jgi:hypothetical protein